MAGPGKRPIAVYGAIIANSLIAVTKFVAAAVTGSSAMLSEGIHSVVDTGNQCLLLLGIRRSKRVADRDHPFGYGKELYFWSLIVAILLFGLGGGMSFYEGIQHLKDPHPVGNPLPSYIVLFLAFVFEGASFSVAVRELRKRSGDHPLVRSVLASKDPAVFVVVVEDAAALTGLVLAFLGVYGAHRFREPALDGIASLLIGVVLAAVAVLLAIESKNLLVGEAVDDRVADHVRRIILADTDVEDTGWPLTMHLGPEEVLLNLDIVFRRGMTGRELAEGIDRVEKLVREAYPQVRRVFIEAQALAGPQLRDD